MFSSCVVFISLFMKWYEKPNACSFYIEFSVLHSFYFCINLVAAVCIVRRKLNSKIKDNSVAGNQVGGIVFLTANQKSIINI